MSGPPPKPTTCKEAIKRFETAKGRNIRNGHTLCGKIRNGQGLRLRTHEKCGVMYGEIVTYSEYVGFLF